MTTHTLINVSTERLKSPATTSIIGFCDRLIIISIDLRKCPLHNCQLHLKIAFDNSEN